MKYRDIDALLANLDLVTKERPAIVHSPRLDADERAIVEVATDAAPDTVKRWFKLAGGIVTRLETGQGGYIVEFDWW